MRLPHGYWVRHVRAGKFTIQPDMAGRWEVFFEEEPLGCFASDQAALQALLSGRTKQPSSGIDTSSVGLPDDITRWTFEPFE